jgi:hypothetical protein
MFNSLKKMEIMSIQNSLISYGNKFNSHVDFKENKNFISSSFGAWLLLATIAGSIPTEAYSESQKVNIENVLGSSIDDAYAKANTFLEKAPKSLKVLVTSWLAEKHIAADSIFSEWAENQKNNKLIDFCLGIPTQNEADTWTEEKTLGLIKKFPLEVLPSSDIISASVVALKVSWSAPFTETHNLKGMSFWKKDSFLLSSNKRHKHAIYDLDGILYALHAVESADTWGRRILVSSVIGPASIPSQEVMSVAQRIVAKDPDIQKVQLDKLSLGQLTDYIELTERSETIITNTPTSEYSAILPAWEVSSQIDVLKDGFSEVAEAFGKDVEVEVAQSAVAAYNLNGFEAAAVTAATFRTTGLPSYYEATVRIANITYSHPYAIVVHSDNKEYENVSLFTGWISEAADVEN